MVALDITTIRADQLPLLHRFLAEAGNLSGFRYFQKRPVEVVLAHELCIVVSYNGAPVAYGHLDGADGKIWLGVAVTEAARGQGWGSFTVKTLLQAARAAAIPVITLSVDHDNVGARGLYERLGFQEVSSHEHYAILQFKTHA